MSESLQKPFIISNRSKRALVSSIPTEQKNTMSMKVEARIKTLKVVLRLTYTQERLSGIELKKGELNVKHWESIGLLLPTKIDHVPIKAEAFKNKVSYHEIKPKPKSEYQQFVDSWFSFFQDFAGFPHKRLTARDGKAIKEIITYLTSIDQEKPLVVFQQLLSHWNQLDKFHHKNTNLSYINSKISNLLKELKDVNEQARGEGVDEDFLSEINRDMAG